MHGVYNTRSATTNPTFTTWRTWRRSRKKLLGCVILVNKRGGRWWRPVMRPAITNLNNETRRRNECDGNDGNGHEDHTPKIRCNAWVQRRHSNRQCLWCREGKGSCGGAV